LQQRDYVSLPALLPHNNQQQREPLLDILHCWHCILQPALLPHQQQQQQQQGSQTAGQLAGSSKKVLHC
jgi:hypothetical protein